MKSAYLIGYFTVAPRPVLQGSVIRSEPWRRLTLRHNTTVFYADIAEGVGDIYPEAIESLKRVIAMTPGLHWVDGWFKSKNKAIE
jgi:hypothetical protein